MSRDLQTLDEHGVPPMLPTADGSATLHRYFVGAAVYALDDDHAREKIAPAGIYLEAGQLLAHDPRLDGEDLELLLGALHTSYTWTLDALGNCLLDNGRPRVPHDPATAAARTGANREAADRIERLIVRLGGDVDKTRREHIEQLARGETS